MTPLRVLVYFGLLSPQASLAAFEPSAPGGRMNAMGGAGLGSMGDPWCAFSNPAALPTVHERCASFAIAPEPFGLPELSRMYFSYVEPLKELSLSVSGLRSGFDLYHETTISLSAGMTAFTGLRCGVCVNGFILAIRNYGQATSFDIDVGMQFNAAGDLSFGFVMQNLTSGTIGVAKERLPQALSSGISYQPIAAASLTLDLVKDSRFPLETRFGVEYIAADIVPIRAGIATEPSMLSAGLGIHTSLVEIDYAMTEHPELGLTHQFSLTLRLGGG